MKQQAAIILFTLALLGCSSDDSTNLESANQISTIKAKLNGSLKPDTKGMKEKSAKKYRARFNALIAGITSQDIVNLQKIAIYSCDGVNWDDYAKEKKITNEGYMDSIRLKRSCYAGTTLAFVVDSSLKEYRADAATQMYNIMLEVGLSDNEIVTLLTGDSEPITFHFATLEDTYNYALKNKSRQMSNYRN